jgi:hypothetical protein
MDDAYPESIPLEIDRPLLQRYLRAKWLLFWLIGLGSLGAMAGFARAGNHLEESGRLSITEIAAVIARGVGMGLLYAFIAAVVFYLVLSHRQAARYARSLDVTVEGPFLRIRYELLARVDRKLHFRNIMDYSVIESAFMRHMGIAVLQMSVPGPQAQSLLQIAGIKNCLTARDMLADIDRLRENK